MTIHIKKLAVGVEDVEHLEALHQIRMAEEGDGVLRHYTRNSPKRQKELLDGGSIYWVIKGAIRARQAIIGVESTTDSEGTPRCALHLEPGPIPTQSEPHRAFQGWRYLEPAKAPPDRGDGAGESSGDELPGDMERELRELGLL